MRELTYLAIVAAAVALIVVMPALGDKPAAAQAPPAQAYLYSGAATAGGHPVPAGYTITAHVLDYSSEPVTVRDGGRYLGLRVLPPGPSYYDQSVTFRLGGMVMAEETDEFVASSVPQSLRGFDLTFPLLPDPTPTPTPVPASPTPTPIVVLPAVYEGLIVVAGGPVPEDARLVARIGAYESPPAAVDGETYRSLVVDPNVSTLVGSVIEFYLNGYRSRNTSSYVSGARLTVDLVFVGLPAATPTPTRTPTPTATATPPAYADAHPDPDGDRHAHAHADAHPDSDGDRHAHAHVDAHPDPDGDRRAYACGGLDRGAHARRSGYLDAGGRVRRPVRSGRSPDRIGGGGEPAAPRRPPSVSWPS